MLGYVAVLILLLLLLLLPFCRFCSSLSSFSVAAAAEVAVVSNPLRELTATPQSDVELEPAISMLNGSIPMAFRRANVTAACASALSVKPGETPPISMVETTQTTNCLGSVGIMDG